MSAGGVSQVTVSQGSSGTHAPSTQNSPVASQSIRSGTYVQKPMRQRPGSGYTSATLPSHSSAGTSSHTMPSHASPPSQTPPLQIEPSVVQSKRVSS